MVRLLNLRPLTRHPLRSGLAVLAVAAGTSLVVGVAIDARSISSASTQLGRGFSGPAPLRVVGPTMRGGLLEPVVDRVAAVPGVASAVPVVQAVTIAQSASGGEVFVVAFGVDCRAEALIGPIGCSPEAVARARDDDPPVVSSSLARLLGPSAFLRTNTGRVSLATAPKNRQLDRVNDGRVVVFPLPLAQRRFARVGLLDAIYVKPANDVSVEVVRERLQRAVGPQSVVLRASDPPPVPLDFGTLPLLGLLAVLALGVGAMLVYSILSLALAERRRDLAIAAALGGRPGLILAGVLAESGTIGLVGGIMGAAAGVVVAKPLVDAASDLTRRFIGVGVPLSVDAGSLVLGVALGVAVSLAAALVPIRRATRMDVAAELHGRAPADESRPRAGAWRSVVYLGACAFGLALSEAAVRRGGIAPWQPGAGYVGMVLATAASLVAVGSLAPRVVAALHRGAASAPSAVGLATTDLAAASARVRLVAVALGTAVGFGVAMANALPSIRDVSVSLVGRPGDDDVLVDTVPYTNYELVDAKLPPAVAAELPRIPGVASVERHVFVEVGNRARDSVGVSGLRGDLLPRPVVEGRTPGEVLARGEVLVGTTLARQRRLRPGSTLTLPTQDGMVRLTVGAVWLSPSSNGRSVAMDADRVAALWHQQASGMFVRPVPGVSPSELASRIVAARLDPDLRVQTGPERAAETSADISAQLAPFRALHRGMLLVAFVAAMSTLLLMAIQRRREIGVLLALGLSPAGLGRLVVVETAILGAVAAALGIAASLPIFEAVRANASIIFGALAPFRFSLRAALVQAAVGVLVVTLAALLPAWRTARLQVVEALRDE